LVDVYDEEDDQYYQGYTREVKDFNNNEWFEGEKKGISHWYELIKKSGGSWSYTPA